MDNFLDIKKKEKEKKGSLCGFFFKENQFPALLVFPNVQPVS